MRFTYTYGQTIKILCAIKSSVLYGYRTYIRSHWFRVLPVAYLPHRAVRNLGIRRSLLSFPLFGAAVSRPR